MNKSKLKWIDILRRYQNIIKGRKITGGEEWFIVQRLLLSADTAQRFKFARREDRPRKSDKEPVFDCDDIMIEFYRQHNRGVSATTISVIARILGLKYTSIFKFLDGTAIRTYTFNKDVYGYNPEYQVNPIHIGINNDMDIEVIFENYK